MTLESLNAFGANTAEGLARCMNNEPFYLRMVGMVLADKSFAALQEAIDAGDAHAAFDAAHALKGTTGSVSLTPLYEPVSTLTDLLRSRDDIPEEAQNLLEQIMDRREKALEL